MSATSVTDRRKLVRQPKLRVCVQRGASVLNRMEQLIGRVSPPSHPSHDLRWLGVLATAFRHEPVLIEAYEGDELVGWLPLALVQGRIFGRFAVSLPYVNSAGVQTEFPQVAEALIDQAADLADECDVRFLEVRHEAPVDHARFTDVMDSKINMRLELPKTMEELWKGLDAKVRNQVRKGMKNGLAVRWGRDELLGPFYSIFCQNMRDLGTPVYSQNLFKAILRYFPSESEICVVYLGELPVAASILVHGAKVTEVPSASSLRKYNATNANMLMYENLLARAIERGQRMFDFGRCTIDSSTYRFKKQWGAQSFPCVWQYYVRRGTRDHVRPDNGRNQRLRRVWQRLPVFLTRCLGPVIVRGIP